MRLRHVTCSVPDCLHQEVIVAENFMITLYNVFSISCFWWSTMLDVLMCILQYNYCIMIKKLETFFTGFLDWGTLKIFLRMISTDFLVLGLLISFPLYSSNSKCFFFSPFRIYSVLFVTATWQCKSSILGYNFWAR